MKGDGNAFVYVIFIFQHVPTTYKGGATASVHCIGDIHTAFAREDALEMLRGGSGLIGERAGVVTVSRRVAREKRRVLGELGRERGLCDEGAGYIGIRRDRHVVPHARERVLDGVFLPARVGPPIGAPENTPLTEAEEFAVGEPARPLAGDNTDP